MQILILLTLAFYAFVCAEDVFQPVSEIALSESVKANGVSNIKSIFDVLPTADISNITTVESSDDVVLLAFPKTYCEGYSFKYSFPYKKCTYFLGAYYKFESHADGSLNEFACGSSYSCTYCNTYFHQASQNGRCTNNSSTSAIMKWKSLSAAAIVFIVLGSLAGAALLGGVGFYVYRKHYRPYAPVRLE